MEHTTSMEIAEFSLLRGEGERERERRERRERNTHMNIFALGMKFENSKIQKFEF